MLSMMKNLCVVAVFCLSGSASWAQNETATEEPAVSAGKLVYKSVDANGKVIFTDSPTSASAEAIKVNAANTIPATRLSSDETGSEMSVEEQPEDYTIAIISPPNDEVLGQEVESVTLAVDLNPGLKKGDSFQLYYDGKLISSETSYTVSELERGTHTVEAKILDSKGAVVKAAQSVQFHVRRTSVLNPNNPNNPNTPKPTPNNKKKTG